MKPKIKSLRVVPIVIASTVTAIVTSSTFITKNKVTAIKQENEELKQQLKYTKISNKSYVEEVTEVNRNNCKLIIYESSKGQYIKSIEEDSLLPVKSTLITKYSYKVEIDLSKAKVMEINNVTYVEIDYNTIKLSSISIDRPKIVNQTNLITQFKGKSISEINNQIIMQSYEEIEQHITKDYNTKQDTLKLNLQNKVNQLYKDLNVVVKYK